MNFEANSIRKQRMKKTKKDPGNYNLTDLLNDPDFIIWVTAPNAQSDSYWASVQTNHPYLHQLIGEARDLILGMRFEQQLMGSLEYEKLWELIAQNTIQVPTKRPVFSIWIRTMAAAVLAFAIFGAGLYFYSNRQIGISTEYGQMKNLILPDGSELVLNANSSVKYHSKFERAKPREIWLKGEAFFKVKHLHNKGNIAKGDLFIVHVGGADIKVLGTTFNVKDRRGIVNVALLEGTVSVKAANDKHKGLIMRPGQLVYYDRTKDSIFLENGNITASQAWKDGLLIFQDLSVEELFKQLEDTYGYHAVFKNVDLKKKKISGTFSTGNYDNLLKGVGIALDISIKKEENSKQLIVR